MDAADGRWTVQFDGSGSTDDYGITLYEWDFDDGSDTVEGMDPTHVYFPGPGSYDVTLTVTDQAAQTDSETITLTIAPNDPPVADAGGPYSVTEGEIIAGTAGLTFDASASTDDVEIYRYMWDFGTETFDGSFLDTNKWDVSPMVVQNFNVKVPGTGSWGNRYIFTSDTLTKANGLVFEAKALDPAGNARGMLGFKNDSTTNYSYNQMPYAFYLYTGEIHIYEDGHNRGDTGFIYNANVWYDYKIEIMFDKVVYSYRQSDSGDDWQVVYTSTYQTGSTQLKRGLVVSHYTVYLDDLHQNEIGSQVTKPINGPGAATLTVEDHAHQVDSETVPILVTGSAPPVANAGGPYISTFGFPVTFNGTASTDDIGIVDYYWDFGDGTTGLGPTPQHIYDIGSFTEDQTFPVTLTVRDGGGQTNSSTTSITLDVEPLVVCVPWQFSGGKEVPHHTWNGKTVRLKGTVKGGVGELTYTWSFGDGSDPVSGTVSDPYAIEVQHTYEGAIGALFVATLTVEDSQGSAHSDTYPVEILPDTLDTHVDVAIDEGLWWLHKHQQRSPGSANDGRWSSYGYPSSETGAALQAFFINGHREIDDPAEDPYVETGRRGMAYIFKHLSPVNISSQTYGDPDFPFDGSGNGIGIQASTSNRQPYEGGLVMDAIASSGTPAAKAWCGGTHVFRRTYKEILQDMVDAYCWGQYDSSSVGGGWRYGWNSHPDNSACQWAAIGMIPAADPPWNCGIPQWVKDRNDVWLNYSFNAGNRSFGYTNTGNGNYSSIACRPSGMVQMVMSVPDYKSDTRWTETEAWFVDNWDWFLGHRTHYGWYAFVKAMRLSNTHTLSNGFDWFRGSNGIAEKLTGQLESDGSWPAGSQVTHPHNYRDTFVTSWAVVMLTPSLFELPPVAEAGQDVIWAYDLELEFDASRSYHLDPSRSIVLYEWDFDGDGTYDWSGADPKTTHTYAFDSELEYPFTYTAVLRVTDNEADTDTATRRVVVAEPPHAPYAIATGPEVATAGLPVTISAGDSFDIDPGDFITRYEWDLNGSDGYDFDNPDHVGDEPEENTVTTTYASAGVYFIGLRVWDNGVLNLPNNDPLPSEPDFFKLIIEPNIAPVADAGGPYTIDEGALLALDGTGSTDPNGDPIDFAWDLDDDGTFDDSTDPAPSKTWMDDGTYNIALNVSDTLLDDTDATTVTVLDLKPTAEFTWNPQPANEGATVSFVDQSVSSPDSIVSWDWDFAGLGSSGGQAPTFAFPDDGQYDVQLTVTDDDGSTDSVIHTVTVVDLSPAAAFNWLPRPQIEGEPVDFTDASTSPSDAIVSWDWDFDGLGTSDEQNPTFTFADNGQYDVQLTVTDDDGSTDTVANTVTILDRAPTAEFTWAPEPQLEGQPVDFTDTSTSPLDAIVSWEWDFDGPGTSNEQDPTFTFTDDGQYDVQLIVTDDDGSTDTITHTVTILDSAPTAQFTWTPTQQYRGFPVDFADLSTSPADIIVAWEWDFGGLGTSSDQNPTFAFGSAGTHTVGLTVTDSDGSSGSISHDITIKELIVTANNDTAAVPENDPPIPVDVMANDISPVPFEIVGKTDGSHGTVVITGGGSGLTYEPEPDYFGTDTFTYTVENTAGFSDTASVHVDVLLFGDVNVDFCINVADLLLVRNNLGQVGSNISPERADINSDGLCNVADLLMVRNRLGAGNCP